MQLSRINLAAKFRLKRCVFARSRGSFSFQAYEQLEIERSALMEKKNDDGESSESNWYPSRFVMFFLVGTAFRSAALASKEHSGRPKAKAFRKEFSLLPWLGC